jgi:cell wall-associated NlpC family hydrolase
MNQFFNTIERRAALLNAALAWRDTPFAPHAAVKGAGVDCVHLVAGILQEVGALPAIEWPRYALDSGVHAKESALLGWLDQCPEFERIADFKSPLASGTPGDVICFNLGLSEHHIGLMLDAQRFIHVLPQRRVIVSSLNESYYGRRVTAVYRPQEPS